ncbi:MAG: hypothetical protein H7145_03055 [Akkermansiaceae bacterium]|nr:hypothetical protein [Armatimonadota bacterium]
MGQVIMRFRWWNSFNVLAVILLFIGIAGAISGGKMVFDPGRASSGREWIIYVVAGGLMLFNGFLPPSNPHEDEEETPRAKNAR